MAKVKEATATVKKVKEKESLTERLKTLIKKEAESWYEVAVTAFDIYTAKEWEKLGYASCKDYVTSEFESLGYSYTTFMYKVKMGEAITAYDIKPGDVANIGWSKFKDIASLLLTKSVTNVSELIKEAEELSSRELQEKIKNMRLSTKGEETEKSTVFRFKLLESQAKLIADALTEAENLCQTDNPNIALVYIATDFLMNHATDNAVINKIREEVVSLFEKKKATKADKGEKHKYSGRKKQETKEEDDFEFDFDEE